MPANKQDVISTISEAQRELERLVQHADASFWEGARYEQGWNAKQVLCHIAATSGMPAMFLNAVKAGQANMSMGADFDLDAWNARGVAGREGKSVQEIAGEISASHKTSIETVGVADDSLLQKTFRAPWGHEGPLAEVIIGGIRNHEMAHLRDLSG